MAYFVIAADILAKLVKRLETTLAPHTRMHKRKDLKETVAFIQSMKRQ